MEKTLPSPSWSPINSTHPEKCALFDYCNTFEKSERECFFQNKKSTVWKVKDGIEVTESFMASNLRNII